MRSAYPTRRSSDLYGTLKLTAAQPTDLNYALDDRPPPVTLVVLAAQHVFIAFSLLVVPVLVAVEAGLARSQAASVVSMSLIAMGIVTLLQVKRRTEEHTSEHQ